jgi:hypothetical protein
MTWEECGRYFGYPECCIDYFVQEVIGKNTPLTAQQKAVHGHRGFIPCPTCAQKVTHDTLHTHLLLTGNALRRFHKMDYENTRICN